MRGPAPYVSPAAHTICRWLQRIWITAGLSFVAWHVRESQARGVGAMLLPRGPSVEEPHTGGVRLFVPPAATLESPGLVCQPGDTDAPVADAPLLRAVARC